MKTVEQLDKQQELPDRDRFYHEDAQQILGLGKTAVNSRKRAANITPHQDENRRGVYFDRQQMQELINCHNYTLTGGILESYRGQYHDATKDAIKDADSFSLEVASEANLALADKDNVWYEPLRNISNEIMMSDLAKKLLRLEAYCKLSQPISDKDCIEILDFKPPRTGFRNACYQFNFWAFDYVPGKKTKQLEDGSTVEVDCLVKQKLWKLVKVDLEAEQQAKLVKKAKRQAEKEQAEAEDGGADAPVPCQRQGQMP